jgi:hypothetical protein
VYEISSELINEVIGGIFDTVLERYGEEILQYYKFGFYEAIQLLNEISKVQLEQIRFQESLKVAEAFQAYKNTSGGIN